MESKSGKRGRPRKQNRTFSMGRVKQATVTAATRTRRRAILRADPHVNAIEMQWLQGLHPSTSTPVARDLSSPPSGSTSSSLRDKRALNPPKFARFNGSFSFLSPPCSFPSSSCRLLLPLLPF